MEIDYINLLIGFLCIIPAIEFFKRKGGMSMRFDLLQHMLASYGIQLTLYIITDSLLWSIGLCLAIGIGKEIFDYFVKGLFDRDDLYADIVGALAGVGVIWVF